MSELTLQDAYDTAFAVVSPRVRFVEWKLFEVRGDQAGAWWPYASYKGGSWNAWQDIDGERWIYAFRRPQGATKGPAVLVAELFHDADGQLHATPMEKLAGAAHSGTWPERGKRGAQVPIGRTACFVRQLLGEPLVHFFFASRVQLPTKAILELQNHISSWTEAVTFEPNDSNVFQFGNGDPVVPVLDPITIATALHAYYIAASNDLVKYMTPVDDPDDPHSDEKKEIARRRQKKFLLAQLVTSLLDSSNNQLAAEMGEGERDPDTFLADYEKQVKYRTEWKERWARYLCNWLQARPILLLAEAHQFQKEEFPQFLLHMAHCHSRISDSPAGRKLLTAHFEQPAKFPWVQKYALGRVAMPDDEWKAIRKLGSAPLEFVKEHVPVWMAEKTVAMEVEEVLKKMFAPLSEPLKIGRPKGKAWEHLGWSDWLKTPEGESLKFVEVEKVDLLIAGKLDGELELTPMWKGAVHKLLEGIELINFALTLHAFEKTPAKDRTKKVVAFVELVGAGLDLGVATLTLFEKGSKATIGRLCFYSAVIDTVTGAREMWESAVEGKFGKALGLGFVTAGSAIIAIGVFAESTLAGPVGLVIVGVGYVIKLIFRDRDDYETFVNFSSFGRREGEAEEKPGWYETEKKFAEWTDEIEGLDEQLRAAVMLLCKFGICPEWIDTASAWGSYEDILRKATITMGWVPKDAKLNLRYREQWVDAHDSRDLVASVDFGADGKPKVSSSGLSVKVGDGGKLIVQGPNSGKPVTSGYPDAAHPEYPGVNKDLKKITLTGSLEVKLDDVTVAVEGHGVDRFSGENTSEKEVVLYKP